MNYLDLTLPTPEENLACDEALLDAAELAQLGPTLRLWQPADYFVVLGYSESASREVNLPACLKASIPVLRRCSGGGTVLQGPGCLNYALILPCSMPGLETITAANRFVMQRHRRAVGGLLGQPVKVQGVTDLAVRMRKFSGNSQRRKRHHLLFHGTFLLNFNLELIERYLRSPSRPPAYRQQRVHRDFLTQLTLPVDTLKTILRSAWDANDPLPQLPKTLLDQLVAEKYSRPDWNLRKQ